MSIRVRSASSLTSRMCHPSMPLRTVSSWPANPITTGTAPADIASTVVIPKCSRRPGCRSASSPMPDACQ